MSLEGIEYNLEELLDLSGEEITTLRKKGHISSNDVVIALTNKMNDDYQLFHVKQCTSDELRDLRSLGVIEGQDVIDILANRVNQICSSTEEVNFSSIKDALSKFISDESEIFGVDGNGGRRSSVVASHLTVYKDSLCSKKYNDYESEHIIPNISNRPK